MIQQSAQGICKSQQKPAHAQASKSVLCICQFAGEVLRGSGVFMRQKECVYCFVRAANGGAPAGAANLTLSHVNACRML